VIAMDDTEDKKPNNIVPFPKKFKRPISPEQDKEMQKKIAVEHQKIFCQQMADELCENILVRLHGENIKVTDKTFLKDYKLVAEAIMSMLLRTQKIKHPLQDKVDKSVITKHGVKNNLIYSIQIDYDKL